MGVFKSLRQLRRQADEFHRGFDPAAQMRQGMAAMQEARQHLANQQSVAHLATTGVPATATIVSLRETGTYVNNMPSVEVQLMVTPDGRPPFPATWTGLVPLLWLGQLRPGGALAVRFDPVTPSSLTVVWGQPA